MFAGGHHFRDNRNRKFEGRKQRSMPNAHVRSEIKDLEQVRKERQKKANKIAHMKSKSTRGKGSGRNGKRGRGKY